jgi:UDP-N-acetylmuramyl pentapeptide phosphotransferase/UDP-N-acetylglucosamine-1-phosphate transferase
MKSTLRNLFHPILRLFEAGEGEYRYEKSHRKILLAVGGLFLFLSAVSAALALASSQWGGLAPVLVFFLLGLVCEVIGLLGNDRAVAKIWGNR